VWQFAPTKVFDPDDFAAFLQLLPKRLGSLALRHAIDVRHPSFKCAEYLRLARRHGVATVFADSDDYPSFADLSADFVYARLMKSEAQVPTGYAPERIAFWADCARTWAAGGDPVNLPRLESSGAAASTLKPRDVFMFFISGAKERAPAAAVATLAELGRAPADR
jgi:uncharacterized protein YecE (DUF72 family)